MLSGRLYTTRLREEPGNTYTTRSIGWLFKHVYVQTQNF